MKPRDNPSSRYTMLQDLGPEGTGPLLSTESLEEQNNHESGYLAQFASELVSP
jgi:hypothetical protein